MTSTTEWPVKFYEFFSDACQLQEIIAILGMDELSEQDKIDVSRAQKNQQRFLSQPFFVAARFTAGLDGQSVSIQDTCQLT